MFFLCLIVSFLMVLSLSTTVYLNVSFNSSTGSGSSIDPFSSLAQAFRFLALNEQKTAEIIVQDGTIIDVNETVLVNYSLTIESQQANFVFLEDAGFVVNGSLGNLSFSGVVFSMSCGSTVSALTVINAAAISFQSCQIYLGSCPTMPTLFFLYVISSNLLLFLSNITGVSSNILLLYGENSNFFLNVSFFSMNMLAKITNMRLFGSNLTVRNSEFANSTNNLFFELWNMQRVILFGIVFQGNTASFINSFDGSIVFCYNSTFQMNQGQNPLFFFQNNLKPLLFTNCSFLENRLSLFLLENSAIMYFNVCVILQNSVPSFILTGSPMFFLNSTLDGGLFANEKANISMKGCEIKELVSAISIEDGSTLTMQDILFQGFKNDYSSNQFPSQSFAVISAANARLFISGNIVFSHFYLTSGYFIYSESSEVLISSLSLYNNASSLFGFLLCFDVSFVSIDEFAISERNSVLFGKLLDLKDSEILMNRVVLHVLPTNDGIRVIDFISSRVFIQNCSNVFSGIYSLYSSIHSYFNSVQNILNPYYVEIIASDLIFIGFSVENCSEFRVLLRDMSRVLIINSSFVDISDGFSIKIEQTLGLFIKDSTFRNISSGDYILIVLKSSLFVLNCSFTNNKGFISLFLLEGNVFDDNFAFFLNGSQLINNSLSGNGSINIKNMNVLITYNEFSSNYAFSGACFYYSELINSSRQAFFSSNSFFANVAELEGGAIKYTGKRPIIDDISNVFNENSANYGPNMASYPIELVLLNESSQLLTVLLISEQMQNSVFKFMFLDADGQICSAYQGSLLVIIDQIQIPPTVNVSLSVSNGTFELTTLLISYLLQNQASNFSITLQCQSENSYYSYTLNGSYQCTVGQIIDNDGNCRDCPFGTYFKSNVCANCPENTICSGDNLLTLMPGYWSSNQFPDDLYLCEPDPSLCIGGEGDVCLVGYQGPLCQACVNARLMNFISMECSECDSNVIIAKFFAFGFFVLLFALLLKADLNICQLVVADKSSINLEGTLYNHIHMYSYLKIFLNYLQLGFLLRDIEILWSSEIKNFLNLQFSISNFSELFSIIECFFKGYSLGGIPNIYLNAILVGLFPFVFLCVMGGLGCFLCLFRRNVVSHMKKSVLLAFYVFSVTVIYFMLRLLNCVQIGPDIYLKFYLSNECFDEDHNYYVRKLVVPVVIFWFAVYQVFLIVVPLFVNRKRLTQFSIKNNLGYLYHGYSTNFFYWELLVILRKFTVLLLATVFHFDAIARALLIVLVLFAFIYGQIKTDPFSSPVLNYIEYRSLVAILATLFFSLIYHFKQDELTRVLSSIIILIMHIFFLYIWLIQMLSTQYENIVLALRFFPKLQKMIISLKMQFDLLEEDYNKKTHGKKLNAVDKVRMSISKAMNRISHSIGNQRKSIKQRLSKIMNHFNYARPSFNKT